MPGIPNARLPPIPYSWNGVATNAPSFIVISTTPNRLPLWVREQTACRYSFRRACASRWEGWPGPPSPSAWSLFCRGSAPCFLYSTLRSSDWRITLRSVSIHSSSLPSPSYSFSIFPLRSRNRMRLPPNTKSKMLPLSTDAISDRFNSPEILLKGQVCPAWYQITRRFVKIKGPHAPPKKPLTRAATPSRMTSSPSSNGGLG